MLEFWAYHKSLWTQGKPVMAGTASVLINVTQLLVLRLVDDPKKLSTILFWILLFITLASFYWAAFLAWRDQYRRADSLKLELDAIYADVVLDWLLQNHAKTFPALALANAMKYDLDKITRGLKLLESEFKVVRDDGAVGWFFDAEKAIMLGLYSNLRRLPPK